MPINAKRREEIRSQLRFSDPEERKAEDLSTLTVEQLKARVKQAHQGFRFHTRKAADHAKAAGEALNELKVRAGHGNWEAWVKANLDIKKSTAERYMRIADKWDRIVAHGLDQLPDLTLEDLRYFLSEPRSRLQEPTREEPPVGGEAADGESPAGRGTDRRATDVVGVKLDMPADRKEKFKAMVESLEKALNANQSDVVYQAVLTMYQEKCLGQNVPTEGE